jgi:multiple antibiotic resistance protein
LNFSDFINNFIALLVVTNPLSALPAVLKITRNQSLPEKKKTGITAALAVGVILLGSTWGGSPLLKAFGIKLPAFQIAGGLVLLVLAFSMLNAQESTIKQTIEEQKEKRPDSGAIVPLAMPIIAGPGAISTVILHTNQHPGALDQLLISFSAILVAFVMGLILYSASHLEKIFGQTGINIFNRIGGLLLAAIAIQSITNGLIDSFPGLKG